MAYSRLTHILLGVLIAGLPAMTLSSCSQLHEDFGECPPVYRLPFRYTRNILNSDAFSSQVSGLKVALYDQSGRMVLLQTDERELTPENDYTMEFHVGPGVYDILTWGSGASITGHALSFAIEGLEPEAQITMTGAELHLSGAGTDLYSDRDIHRLYYGYSRGVEFPEPQPSPILLPPVELTKDTNHITLILQNEGEDDLDPERLSFSLEASNSILEWDNFPTATPAFRYLPWSIEPVWADFSKDDPSAYSISDDGAIASQSEEGAYNGLIAEFTTGRLMADCEQRLTVTDRLTEKEIFSIPLIEYLLLVRNHYQEAESAQDYLDRYDDFTLVFFIGEGYRWIKSRILINGWRVVPPQHNVLGGE